MSKKVALLIGVSEYGEGIPSLSAPLNDVAAMKRVLENPNMGGFDEVETLINPDIPAMQTTVQQIFANCHKDDLVLLFFSGHGITDDNNKLYLTTKGTSKDFYQATSVPASFIQDRSLESYAKRQVIVLDCCDSGAFAEGWQAKSVGLELEKELGAEGRVVLTSSTATQTSFQQEGEELSLYTNYLLEGIETGGADKEGNGKIYARELHDYAKAKVQEVKPKQQPGIIIDKEGFNILLCQAPVDDPELDYRKLVEKYATEGQITVTGNYILRIKRQELGIRDEKSDEIINEVLAPYRKRLEKVEVYKKAFTEAIEKNYPLTERLLNELQDLQDILGLEDKDIAKVKEQILPEKEVEHQQDSPTTMTAEEFFESGLDKDNQGDSQGAIEDFTQVIELKTDYADAYYNRGQIYEKQEDYQKAIDDYSKAIELNPKAMADCNKAIELNPNDATAYFFRGITYGHQEDYQPAIQDFTQVIELQPDYDFAYLCRSIVHLQQEDYQKAIADFNKAIELKPDNADFYYLRGAAYSKLKDYQKALADFNKALELQPDNADAYYYRGLVYYDRKDYQKALADFNKALELKPDYTPVYFVRGSVAQYYLHDYNKAMVDYNKAIELKPDFADPYYYRGLINKRTQGFFSWQPVDKKAAIQDFTKAAELYQKQGNTKGYQNALNRISEL